MANINENSPEYSIVFGRLAPHRQHAASGGAGLILLLILIAWLIVVLAVSARAPGC